MPFLQKIGRYGGSAAFKLSCLTVKQAAAWLERYQIPLYALAVMAALLVGRYLPKMHLESAVDPMVIALICATFCAVPFGQLSAGLRDKRFLRAVAVVNLVFGPTVVALLCFLLVDDPTLLLPIALVLLAPCVDYAIVFCRLAQGAWTSLLAATPLVMLAQMVLLPLYLSVLPAASGLELQWLPFLRAFGLFVLFPLIVALIVQRFVPQLLAVVDLLMVPLLMFTLFVVVAAFSGTIFSSLIDIAGVVPVFVAFGVIMPVVANFWGSWSGLPTTQRCALSFSATTRNSLVVLPFALAMVSSVPLAPVVVVTQTVVELVVLVVMVAWWRSPA